MNDAEIMTVYVAGPMSGANPAVYETNVNYGIQIASTLLTLGFAPYCPMLDGRLCGMSGRSTVFMKAYSLAMLRRCHGLFLCPGWGASVGAVAEYKEAERLGIPVFKTIEQLVHYRSEHGYGALTEPDNA